ncbi:hematopoietic prostaglandin D synthase-like [Macrobrachium rosenbergii]|uniref:hematopoietic prostaglandin D synthase-like n=1 Tax=Macrobrachium rosenbergii TaxID=79674 RepID=UPI0034D64E8F
MPEYKLIYFNSRGRAELTRWIFAYGGIPYTDERLEKEDWPAVKNTIPNGKLPCLMVDGKPLPQSQAIARYAAKEVGLVPEDNLQSALCDAVVDTITDIAMELYKLHVMTDEEERKNQYLDVKEKTLEPALSYLEKQLNGHEWIVGEKITWADLAIGAILGAIVQRKEDFLASHPKLEEHVTKIQSLPKIQEWIENSPKTEM